MRPGLRRKLREIHGEFQFVEGSPSKRQSDLPNLTVFGKILMIPVLIALVLVMVLISAAVCFFVWAACLVFFGKTVALIAAIGTAILMFLIGIGRLTITR